MFKKISGQLLFLVCACFSSSDAHSKCWLMREFPSSFCATFEAQEVSNVPTGNCIVRAKIIKADRIEGTSERFTLQANEIFSVRAGAKDCAKIKVAKKYERLVTKYCQDVLPAKAKFYLYVNDEGSVQRGGMGGQEVKTLDCNFNKKRTH